MAAKISRPVAFAASGVLVLAGGAAVWWQQGNRAPASDMTIARERAPLSVPALRARLEAVAQDRSLGPNVKLEERGRLYHANGYLAEAEECWRALRRAEPAVALWAYLLADVRNQAGDPDEFEALLREAVRLAPDYAPARLKLAELLFKTGRVDEAAEQYEHRLALLPDDPYARLGLARVAQQRGRDGDAAAAIAALVRDHPKFSPAHNLHAEFLAARGDVAGARRHRWLGREAGRFREAEDPWLGRLVDWCLDPKRLAVHGTSEFQLGNIAQARLLLEKAVELAPEDPGAQELLGDFLLKIGEPAQARQVLLRALALANAGRGAGTVTLYVNLSEALSATGDPQRALTVLDEGRQRLGELAELHTARGVILDGLDRLPEAEAALREAVRLSPRDSAANFNLAVVLLQRERRAEAAQHLHGALAQQPTHAKALALLAQLEMEAGRLDRAGEYLEPLFDAHPGLTAVQELVAFWRLQSGLAAAARGDAAAAELHYRAGIEALPTNADLQISLAGLLLDANRPVEALPALQAYRELRPNAPQGYFFTAQALARLGRRDEARRALDEAESLSVRTGDSAMLERCRRLRQGR